MALLTDFSGRPISDVLPMLRGVAYSLGLNDCLPRGDMAANKFTPGTSSQPLQPKANLDPANASHLPRRDEEDHFANAANNLDIFPRPS